MQHHSQLHRLASHDPSHNPAGPLTAASSTSRAKSTHSPVHWPVVAMLPSAANQPKKPSAALCMHGIPNSNKAVKSKYSTTYLTHPRPVEKFGNTAAKH